MASSDMAGSEAYWRETYGHWPLTPEEAANELHDWYVAFGEVTKVYDELTRGRFTKPNTMADYVIEAVREQEARDEEEELVALRATAARQAGVIAAARAFAAVFPPSGAYLPHAPLGSLGEWRATLLLNLRAALDAPGGGAQPPEGQTALLDAARAVVANRDNDTTPAEFNALLDALDDAVDALDWRSFRLTGVPAGELGKGQG